VSLGVPSKVFVGSIAILKESASCLDLHIILGFDIAFLFHSLAFEKLIKALGFQKQR